MGADDAWSAEIKRLPFTPHPDPLALDDDLAERLLDGDLPLDQTPPGYAEVAALLAATVAAPRPAELAGQEAVLAELRVVTRARRAIPWGSGRPGRRGASGCWSRSPYAACRPLASPPRPPGRFQLPSVTLPGASSRPWTMRHPCHLPVWSTAGPEYRRGGCCWGGQRRPGGKAGGRTGHNRGNGRGRRCPVPASKVGKGAGRSKKLNAVTPHAPVEAARDADNDTRECHKSRPHDTGGNGQEKHPPPDGHGRGPGGEPPPEAGSKPGQGQPGPPPNRGGGS